MTYDGRRAREVLSTHWGFPDFRPGQEDIVRAAVEGGDVFAVMATGAGKSLCYQIPALLTDGLTIVISPLIALMQDQVAGLKNRGIAAETINGSMSFPQREHAWSRVEHGGTSLLFISPETLSGETFRARASRLGITRVAVDEAHCISEWGHDFRRVYRQIPEALEPLGRPPITAVTATATDKVRRDIAESLGLSDVSEHVWPVDRPNIRWEVIRDTNPIRHVLRIASEERGSGIIYGGTRRNARSWARRLSDEGIPTLAYHAGLPPKERLDVQERWAGDDVRIVSATSAFGMGIDKANVRFVIHTMLPGSIESYYQEAGRAGRDGAPSRAVLLSPLSDDDRLRSWTSERYPSSRLLRRVYEVVCDLAGLAVGSEAAEPLLIDTERVAQILKVERRQVGASVSLIEGFGLWQEAGTDSSRTRIVLSESPDALEKAASDHPSGHPVARLANALLRSENKSPGESLSDFETRKLESVSGLDSERLVEGLRFFRERRLIKDFLDGTKRQVSLSAPRLARPGLGEAELSKLRKRAGGRVEDMISYATVADCRRRLLLNYFGEDAPRHCGACDNCLRRVDSD